MNLTVTDPATVPSSPVSPDPQRLLILGLVVGLSLGFALAVVRSRFDTALHTEDDVRAAWGEDDQLSFHAALSGWRPGNPKERPSALLARHLEVLAERQPLHLLAMTPSKGREAELGRLLSEAATELNRRGVPTIVAPASVGGSAADPREAPALGTRVRLEVGTPVVALRDWRRMAERYDGVLLVVEAGSITAAELRELRLRTSLADLRPLALVLLRTRRALARGMDAAPPTQDAAVRGPGRHPEVPVPVTVAADDDRRKRA